MTTAIDAWAARKAAVGDQADSGAPALMDEPAFQSFHRATCASLHSYARRVLGNAAHADDIVQESYLRFLRMPAIVEDPSERRALLFRIASNLIVDHWRKRRWETEARTDAPEVGRPDPDASLRIDMERTFERLSPQQRQLMWLAYVEGMDHREIASALGLGARSVRVLLHRARRKLAGLLSAGGRGPRES